MMASAALLAGYGTIAGRYRREIEAGHSQGWRRLQPRSL